MMIQFVAAYKINNPSGGSIPILIHMIVGFAIGYDRENQVQVDAADGA